ncbi:carboxymuconolactone decarboxylase family protein [Flavobacterium sp. MC2016-06]|jgi:AhpD family alkylhydroperoxidase|uniref:carboxymuconolactone decarboxylase family protein n=1 Tax=Flavobacterium sp. MC2016-06 TaxID=2676308 RepID=UPI0012BB11B0|nr:carboxymuconolactone decarboxylase family protein [Flavobacterium sp. MC2016-06]MBU3857732.1 carboxymuconolactone decarboxylase family protein [Flavobacterium sp. MC2016-06]
MFLTDIKHQDKISEKNKEYIEYFNKKIGYVPNMFVTMMHSENALTAYYPFHKQESSLSKREQEAIALVVSQDNKAEYCLNNHTMIAKLNDFSYQEILELRNGTAHFDPKLNILVSLIKNIIEHKGSVDNYLLEKFYIEGYNQGNLVDALHVVGDNYITNFIGKVFKTPVDFPRHEL